MALVDNSLFAALTGTGTSTVYTVPASTSTTVVSMTLHNASGVTASMQVMVQKGGAGTDIIIFNQESFADGDTAYLDSKLVLETTDVLKIATDQQPVHYSVSMYERS